MSPGSIISEDWEELSDDGFSVVSAPSSEPDLHIVPLSTKVEAASPIISAPPQYEEGTRNSPQPLSPTDPAGTTSHSDTDAVGLQGSVELGEEYGERDEEKAVAGDLGHVPDDEDDEMSDSNVNPTFLLSLVHTLADLVVETGQYAYTMAESQEKEDKDSTRLSSDITFACSLLAEQIKALTPIVSGYKDYWTSSHRDIPLDPGLQGWMSGLRVKFLGLQAEIQRSIRDDNGTPDDRFSGVKNYCAALVDFEKQMSEFLPLMEVDFNEFQTKQMAFPTQTSSSHAAAATHPSTPPHTSLSPIPIRRPNTGPRPSSDIWQLRRSLYKLRDELQRSSVELNDVSVSLPAEAMERAFSVARSYDTLCRSLSTILSNHGSEWIEHGLAGGLTYAEFTEIPLSDMQHFSVTLKQMMDVLEIRRTGSWRPGAAEAHIRRVLLDIGFLDHLELIGGKLASLFNPDRDY